MSDRQFVAAFESERDLLAAVRSARLHNYPVQDVYTPYAVHGLDEAMGLRPSRLSWACLAFAIVGASIGLWLQHWTSTTDWPLNVGGKPFNSLPAFVPITFELTVLFAGLGTVATLFARSRLFPGKKPLLLDPRVTDDLFVLVLAETDATFDLNTARNLFDTYHAAWCGELINGHVHRFCDRSPREDLGEEREHVPTGGSPGLSRRKHRRRIMAVAAGALDSEE